MIDEIIENQFQENGVVLLKKVIDPYWISELQKGVEFNFKNPTNKCL